MAGEVVEKAGDAQDLILVGIRTRGVPIAEAFASQIEEIEGTRPPIGLLDITLYRDDLSTIGPQPKVRETRLPVSVDGRVVVLCDDVLFTGRTIRAALDALNDYGRPKSVKLAVLVDRGLERVSLQVVVAEDAEERRVKGRQRVERLCLGDVAGVDDPVDARVIEQFHDPGHVLHVIVGVAEDSDPHLLAGR